MLAFPFGLRLSQISAMFVLGLGAEDIPLMHPEHLSMSMLPTCCVWTHLWKDCKAS